MDARELRQLILEAFGSVPKPEHAHIAPHRCMECDELADDLAAHEATHVPDDVFQKHVWDLPLLSANAKHYYLPAWLTRCVEVDGPWLPDEASAVLYELDISEHRWDPERSYTREQWRAIREWLEHVAQFADFADAEHLEAARRRVEHEL